MTSVKTILFVENDLVSQTLYQRRLEREGFHVECAQDGQLALDILSERTPDLVLLDLMLPRVSGADVLEFMHADPRLTMIPVIIFSNAPMTEAPPDSPAARGARRLLKSDCPFPVLLETIQEALAHSPELVVTEADKTSSDSAAAPDTGMAKRNGAGAAAAADSESKPSAAKKGVEFLKEAAAMIPKIREHSMGYIKAPNSEASQTHLSGLHQRVHLLNVSAAQADCARVALLTNAFDALLSGIIAKPSTVTPSVLQAIAQAVDCLDGLLKNNDGYSVGPSFRAKVLVVDDDTVCNHVNVTSLKRANFDAVGVKDPAEALKLLETTPFDLVVLDVNMPGMTGFDVCEKMRRLPHCRKTPVIFVTAFSNFDNRKQSVLSGGNDFISKPVSPLELGLKVTVNLIKARVQGVQPPQPETHSFANNGSANGLQPATPARINQPIQTGMPAPEPLNRLAPGIAPGRNGEAGPEQEPAERARLEAQWREQLNATRALIGQTEILLKEKETHYSRLQTELGELRQMRDKLQNYLTAGQQTAANSPHEIGALKINLEKQSAEWASLEGEWRNRFSNEEKLRLH